MEICPREAVAPAVMFSIIPVRSDASYPLMDMSPSASVEPAVTFSIMVERSFTS